MDTKEISGGLKGLHSFKAYKGDLEYDQDGNIVNELAYESPVYENMIVTSGKNLALDRLFGLGSDGPITSVGVGDNSTAASLAQTGLQGTTNVLIKTADAGTSRTGQTVTITATFGTGEANFTWNEAGLFNGNTNNTSKMFNRVVIGPFAKTTAVSIVYQTTVTQA